MLGAACRENLVPTSNQSPTLEQKFPETSVWQSKLGATAIEGVAFEADETGRVREESHLMLGNRCPAGVGLL